MRIIPVCLSLLTAILIVATPVSQAAPKPVSVTYLANEGLLITGSNDKVIIDALFTHNFGIFEAPSTEMIEGMKNATAPYDHLTCLMATHGDLDHIGVAEVLTHLLNDPNATFFAPQEVVQQMQKLPLFDQVKSRAFSAAQLGNPTEQRVGKDLVVRALPLDHLKRPPTMPPPPFNVGFLFTIDGVKFFHTGDMGPQNLQAFKDAKLRDEQIDVVLVNFYFFGAETLDSARAILDYLNPKLVLLAHLTKKGQAREAERILKLPGLPRMLALDKLMQTYDVSRAGADIAITKR